MNSPSKVASNLREIAGQADVLEQALHKAISQCIEDHVRLVGWSPSGVEVQMVDATSIGDPLQRYFVSRIRVSMPEPFRG